MNTFANPQLALAFLISCWAKATLLLAGAWLMVVALRQRSSAAQRHHVWAAAILASLALPFFSLLLPTWHSATLGSAATLWIPAREPSELWLSGNSFRHHYCRIGLRCLQQTCRRCSLRVGTRVLLRPAETSRRSWAPCLGVRAFQAAL